MADDLKPENEEYKGPGKFTAALGKGSVNAMIGDVAGGASGALIGGAITRSKAGAIVGTMIGASVGSLAGLAHGAYKGWNNADAAQEDHKNLTAELKKANNEKDKFVKLLAAQEAAKTDPSKGGRGA